MALRNGLRGPAAGLVVLMLCVVMAAPLMGQAVTDADRAYAEAYVAIGEKDFAQAEFLLREMRARYPLDARWGAPLLMVLEEQGKIQDGLRLGREIATQYARSPEFHLAVGRLWVKSNDFEQAQGEFDQALRLTNDPGLQLTIYATKGEIYILDLQWQQAISAFRKWKEIAGAPSFGLARALGENGQLDEAIAEYRAVMRLAPDDPVLMNNLAYVLAERGTNLDEALALALTSWSVNQASAAVTDTVGWVYFKLGRYAEAEQKFVETISKEGGNHPDTRVHLARTMDARGEWTPERRELRGLLEGEMGPKEARRIKELLDGLGK